jgi:hypothetical protein
MMGGMAEPDPMEMLLATVLGGWEQQEMQVAGEQTMLMDTLMAIAQSQPPAPGDMFAEGAPTNAGMTPQMDVDQMGGPGSVPSFGY